MGSRMAMNWNISTAVRTNSTAAVMYPRSGGNQLRWTPVGVQSDKRKPNLLSVTNNPNSNYLSPVGIGSVGHCCCCSSSNLLPHLRTEKNLLTPRASKLAEAFDRRPLYERGTVAEAEVILEDNNGVFWNELKKLCEDLSSSDESSSTHNMLWELIQLLVRYEKHWIHKDDGLFVTPFYEVPILRHCQWAEYDIQHVRNRTKWLRSWMSGGTSKTVYVSVLACVDKEVGWMQYSDFREKQQDHTVPNVLAKLGKRRAQLCLQMLIWMQLQPGIMLYASNKCDVGRSPSPIIFKAGPSDIERQYIKTPKTNV